MIDTSIHVICKFVLQNPIIITMSSAKASAMREMTFSEYFTVEMCIQYLLKNKSNSEVLAFIVSRLKTYDRADVMVYIIELIFFALNHPCTELEIFLLEMCAEDFKYFFLITTTFEIWGHQLAANNANMKKRVRNMLEDCETSMVNGEKCLINYKMVRSDSGNNEKADFDQEDLYNFVIGKRSKNDLKDDVRYFTNYLVKLAYLLIREDQPKEKLMEISIEYLHKLNLHLYERRNMNIDVIAPYKYVYKGIALSFKNDPNSELVS